LQRDRKTAQEKSQEPCFGTTSKVVKIVYHSRARQKTVHSE